jgi:hypothetical protein
MSCSRVVEVDGIYLGRGYVPMPGLGMSARSSALFCALRSRRPPRSCIIITPELQSCWQVTCQRRVNFENLSSFGRSELLCQARLQDPGAGTGSTPEHPLRSATVFLERRSDTLEIDADISPCAPIACNMALHTVFSGISQVFCAHACAIAAKPVSTSAFDTGVLIAASTLRSGPHLIILAIL